MTANEYLSQYKDIPAEIQQRSKLIRRMEREIFSGPSDKVTGSLSPVIGKSSQQSFWSVEDFERFKKQVQRQKNIISQYRKYEDTVLQQIDCIDDKKLRSVLLGRYINGETWREIAFCVETTEDHVRQTLHKKALEEFTRKFSDKFYKITSEIPYHPHP
ncbi:hypothetical protein [uncultured Megasphaera sp.]|uniref:hypothetical protein n=1 Tax=uncultured Megasphaera sp. TaxID=165188 RepID=UPI00266EE78E|nr:hypothetical protein [uncultured Megasphaera sp.]